MMPYPFPVPVPAETPFDRNKLDDAEREIRSLRDSVAELQRRLEKQAVLVRALFAILSTKQGLTEAELVERFREVEAAKAGTPPKKCSECARGVNQRTHRCIYCGEASEVESAFDFLDLGAWPSLELPTTASASRPPDRDAITTQPGTTSTAAGPGKRSCRFPPPSAARRRGCSPRSSTRPAWDTTSTHASAREPAPCARPSGDHPAGGLSRPGHPRLPA